MRDQDQNNQKKQYEQNRNQSNQRNMLTPPAQYHQYYPPYHYHQYYHHNTYTHYYPPPPYPYYPPPQHTEMYSNHPNLQNNQPSQYCPPIDPRLRGTGNQQQQNNRVPSKPETPKKQKYENYKYKEEANSEKWQSSQQEDEDEEQIYRKTKMIKKHRDPVMDSPNEIKKWIQSRKKNYPRAQTQQTEKRSEKSTQKDLQKQMSILEKKLRKKILLVSSNPKNLLKKIKNMDVLRRIVLGGKLRNPAGKKKQLKKSTKSALTELKKQQKMREDNLKKKQIDIQKQVAKRQQQNDIEQQLNDNQSNSPPVEVPILKEEVQKSITQKIKQKPLPKPSKNQGLTPEDMIKHLQQRQKEDQEYFGKILDYKTNSHNYKYSAKALQTNFLIEDIFAESSYLLQAIRYIVKNNFFDEQPLK